MKVTSTVVGGRTAIFHRRVVQFLPLPMQKSVMLSCDQANMKCDQAVLHALVGDTIHHRRLQFARNPWVRVGIEAVSTVLQDQQFEKFDARSPLVLRLSG